MLEVLFIYIKSVTYICDKFCNYLILRFYHFVHQDGNLQTLIQLYFISHIIILSLTKKVKLNSVEHFSANSSFLIVLRKQSEKVELIRPKLDDWKYKNWMTEYLWPDDQTIRPNFTRRPNLSTQYIQTYREIFDIWSFGFFGLLGFYLFGPSVIY